MCDSQAIVRIPYYTVYFITIKAISIMFANIFQQNTYSWHTTHELVVEGMTDWVNLKNQDKWLKANYISSISMEGNYSMSDLVYDFK